MTDSYDPEIAELFDGLDQIDPPSLPIDLRAPSPVKRSNLVLIAAAAVVLLVFAGVGIAAAFRDDRPPDLAAVEDTEATQIEGDSTVLSPLDPVEARLMTIAEIDQRWGPVDQERLGLGYQQELGIFPPVLEQLTSSEAEVAINQLISDYFMTGDSGERRDIALIALLVDANNLGAFGTFLIDYETQQPSVETSVQVTQLNVQSRLVTFELALNESISEWTCEWLQFRLDQTAPAGFFHLAECFSGATAPEEEPLEGPVLSCLSGGGSSKVAEYEQPMDEQSESVDAVVDLWWKTDSLAAEVDLQVLTQTNSQSGDITTIEYLHPELGTVAILRVIQRSQVAWVDSAQVCTT